MRTWRLSDTKAWELVLCGFNPWVLLGLGSGVGLLCLEQNAASTEAQVGAVCSHGENKVRKSRGLHCLEEKAALLPAPLSLEKH